MAEFSLQVNIGSIKIGSISNASSFNIGRNNLRDFDNMSKRNQGSGDVLGDNNTFPSNTSYVQDPDQVDMWSGAGEEKAKETAEKEVENGMNELSFSSNRIDQMGIRYMASNSGVFSGENHQVSWSAKSKQNQASGNITGDHILSTSSVNMVDDRDIIDTPSNHSSQWRLLPKKE